jgi:hypothetical protein
MAKQDYDLHTFVAGAALQAGQTFQLQCNCGGIAPITPPLSTEFVICPKCMSKIRVMVLEGDPGYLLGKDPKTGKEFLFQAQGSTAPPPQTLPLEEQERIIAQMKKAAGQ